MEQHLLFISFHRGTIIILTSCSRVHAVIPCQSSKARYNLSVTAIFKNECDAIREWLEHYIDEGVEHFYLIDNGSNDQYHSEIQPYIAEGKLTLLYDGKRHAQEELYNTHIQPYLHLSVWMAIVDLDEFIYARHGTLYSYLQNVSSAVGSISVPWKMFGSSGHVEQPSTGVVLNFVHRRGGTNVASNVKSIFRTAAVAKLTAHATELLPSFHRIYPVSEQRTDDEVIALSDVTEEQLAKHELHLNHYAIQSFSWFMRVKATRGDVSNKNVENFRDKSYFRTYDHKEVIDVELKRKKLKLQEYASR